MFDTIRLELADGIATLTLNQPQKRNPMSARMGEEIAVALGDLEARDAARVLVVTGAGEAFSAGGDLALIEANMQAPQDSRQAMLDYYGRYLSLFRLPIPTIAAINGHAIGGGLALALACDLRYAAEEARLGVNFARLGLHPGLASTLLLPRTVGASRALELFYTGRVVSGREAEALGLVTRAFPRDELLPAVWEVARAIGRNAPLVLRLLKQAVQQGLREPLEAALRTEAFGQALTYTTADLREGLHAWRERREPRFTGQ